MAAGGDSTVDKLPCIAGCGVFFVMHGISIIAATTKLPAGPPPYYDSRDNDTIIRNLFRTEFRPATNCRCRAARLQLRLMENQLHSSSPGASAERYLKAARVKVSVTDSLLLPLHSLTNDGRFSGIWQQVASPDGRNLKQPREYVLAETRFPRWKRKYSPLPPLRKQFPLQTTALSLGNLLRITCHSYRVLVGMFSY